MRMSMPEQWNKYAPTAARHHGKPGREARPKSVTIDIHSHVAVSAAAKFVEEQRKKDPMGVQDAEELLKLDEVVTPPTKGQTTFKE